MSWLHVFDSWPSPPQSCPAGALPSCRKSFFLHDLFSLLMGVSKANYSVSITSSSTENLEHWEPAHVDALYLCWQQWAGGAGATSPLLLWLATSRQAQATMDAPLQLAATQILRPLGHQAKHMLMNQTICLLHPPKSRRSLQISELIWFCPLKRDKTTVSFLWVSR